MKIMSVIPAAAASSTAYWISGLSTTGNISLGLALVTGKKRLPRPATGNTALVTLPNAMDHVLELLFIKHRHTELVGFVEFGTRIISCNHIAGLLRHAAADFSAVPLDKLFSVFAGDGRQGAGQHKREAFELAGGHAFRPLLQPLYSNGAQLGNHLTVMRLRQELANASRHHRPDVRHFEQRVVVGRH